MKRIEGSDPRPEWVEQLQQTQCTVRECLALLVEAREFQRDEVLADLAAQAGKVLGTLEPLERRTLEAELSCFRDVLALYKDSASGNGSKD